MNSKIFFLIFLSLFIYNCTSAEEKAKDEAKKFVQKSSQDLKTKTDQILACYQTVKNIPKLASDFLPETTDSIVVSHRTKDKNKSKVNTALLDEFFLEKVTQDFKAKYKTGHKGIGLGGYYNRVFDHAIDYQNGIIPNYSQYKYKNALLAAEDRIQTFLKWQYVIVVRPINAFSGGQTSGKTFVGGSYKGQAVICRLSDAKHLGHATFAAKNEKENIRIYSQKNESPSTTRSKVKSKLNSHIQSQAISALRSKLARFYLRD